MQQKYEKHEPEGPPINLKESYQTLNQNSSLRKARDWCTKLGPFTSLHYTCIKCSKTPLKNNGWWRLLRSRVVPREGLSEGGEGSGLMWACGICGEHWTAGVGNRWRTLIFHEEEVRSPSDRYAFVGDLNSEQENLIQFLKGVEMLTALGGAPITKDALIRVIEIMSTEVEQKLLTLLPEVRQFRAIDTRTHWWAYQFEPYCESATISIQRVGQVFHEADLGLLPQNPRVLLSEQVDFLIDMIASAKNFEAGPFDGPSQRGLAWNLGQNGRVQQARQRLLAICNQFVPRSVAAAGDDDVELIEV